MYVLKVQFFRISPKKVCQTEDFFWKRCLECSILPRPVHLPVVRLCPTRDSSRPRDEDETINLEYLSLRLTPHRGRARA